MGAEGLEVALLPGGLVQGPAEFLNFVGHLGVLGGDLGLLLDLLDAEQDLFSGPLHRGGLSQASQDLHKLGFLDIRHGKGHHGVAGEAQQESLT